MAEEASIKSKGKQRIEIKKIEKKQNLHVTFSKRKNGLLKKASELCILCDAQVAMLLATPAKKKFFTFGSPDLESILTGFESGLGPNEESSPEFMARSNEYKEALRKLDEQKKMLKEVEARSCGWFDDSVSNMEEHELSEYLEALEVSKTRVWEKCEFLKNKNTIDTSMIASTTCLWDSATLDGDGFQLPALPNHEQYVNVEKCSAENHNIPSSSCLLQGENQETGEIQPLLNYQGHNDVENSRAGNSWVASLSSGFSNGENQWSDNPNGGDDSDDIQAILDFMVHDGSSKGLL